MKRLLLFFALSIPFMVQAQPAQFSLPCAGTTLAKQLISFGQINGVAVEPGQDWLGAFDSQGFCIGVAGVINISGYNGCADAPGFSMSVYGSAGLSFGCPADYGADNGEFVEVLLFDGSANLFYVYPGTYQFVNAPTQFPPQNSMDPCDVENATILPVELTRLTARATSRFTSRIDWTTATETANSHFEIERSTDGVQWTTIGRVEGAGDADVPMNYFFEDVSPERTINYYRLKQVDFDGSFDYSHVVFADLTDDKDRELSIFPNPTETQTITLGFEGEWTVGTPTDVRVYDINGRMVANWEGLAAISQTLTLPNLSTGVYQVLIQSGTEELHQRLIVR